MIHRRLRAQLAALIADYPAVAVLGPWQVGKTLASYLDLMVDLLLVRRLPPWHKNVGKRLVKSPKVFVRDSGVLLALLGLRDKEAVISHPIVGASWEGYVIENLINVAPAETEARFYRASGGAEVDLILTLPGKKPWVVEVKRTLEPCLSKGFYFACGEIRPAARYVVYVGEGHDGRQSADACHETRRALRSRGD